MQNNIDAHANFIVGGQIRGEPPRLFHVYSEGNFIEATPDTLLLPDRRDQVRQADHRPRGQPRHAADRRDQVHAGVVRLDDALATSRSACRSTSWSTTPTRCASSCSGASTSPTRTSRWCTRSGARGCGGCSRSFPIPIGRSVQADRRSRPCRMTDRAIRVALARIQHDLPLRPAGQPRRRTRSGCGPRRTAARRCSAIRSTSRRSSTSSTGSRTRTATGSRALVFPERDATSSRSTVDLVADMTVINPFDFFVEPYAEQFPFAYAPALAQGADPVPRDRAARAAARRVARAISRTTIRPGEIDDRLLLVRLNQQLQQRDQLPRAHGAGRADARARRSRCASGSCRDSGWLLVQILRHLGHRRALRLRAT